MSPENSTAKRKDTNSKQCYNTVQSGSVEMKKGTSA